MWQMAKARFAGTTSRDTWRRLARGIAVFFLLANQAWADITCNCQQVGNAQPASQMPHSCYPSTHHSNSEMSEECADVPGANNQPCGNEFVDLSQNVRTCCQSAPQRDVQEMTIFLQGSVQVISTRLATNPDTASSFEFIYRDFHQHSRA